MGPSGGKEMAWGIPMQPTKEESWGVEQLDDTLAETNQERFLRQVHNVVAKRHLQLEGDTGLFQRHDVLTLMCYGENGVW